MEEVWEQGGGKGKERGGGGETGRLSRLCRKGSFLDGCLRCNNCVVFLLGLMLKKALPCYHLTVPSFVFSSFVIFLKLDGVIHSLGLKQGRSNVGTHLSLLCTYFPPWQGFCTTAHKPLTQKFRHPLDSESTLTGVSPSPSLITILKLFFRDWLPRDGASHLTVRLLCRQVFGLRSAVSFRGVFASGPPVVSRCRSLFFFFFPTRVRSFYVCLHALRCVVWVAMW